MLNTLGGQTWGSDAIVAVIPGPVRTILVQAVRLDSALGFGVPSVGVDLGAFHDFAKESPS